MSYNSKKWRIRSEKVSNFNDFDNQNYKKYIFKCDGSCKLEYSIIARTIEEAREYLENKQYDDLDIKNIEIEDICKVEVEPYE